MLDKILYADSGTGHTQEMLKMLLEMPAFQHSQINILHVVPNVVSAEAFAEKWEEGGESLPM